MGKISKRMIADISILAVWKEMTPERLAKEFNVSIDTVEACINYRKEGFLTPESYIEHKQANIGLMSEADVEIKPKTPKRRKSTIDEFFTENELEKMFHGKIEQPFCPDCKSLIKPYNSTSYFYCVKCKQSYLIK